MAPKRVLITDLLDAHQVAELLELAGPQAVGTYRSRYGDFPAPVLPTSPAAGKTLYWLRGDIVRWRAKHPSIGKKARDAGSDPS